MFILRLSINDSNSNKQQIIKEFFELTFFKPYFEHVIIIWLISYFFFIFRYLCNSKIISQDGNYGSFVMPVENTVTVRG